MLGMCICVSVNPVDVFVPAICIYICLYMHACLLIYIYIVTIYV